MLWAFMIIEKVELREAWGFTATALSYFQMLPG